MRRVLILLATAFGVLLPCPAFAGGSLLELRDVEGAGSPSTDPWGGWAGPGTTVTMRGTFGSGSGAGVSAGPWAAYLSPESGRDLTYLAPVQIVPATGNMGSHVASVTFVVPEVTHGRYWVNVCADPRCEIGVIGDLIGGFFTIAATSEEARLLNELEFLQQELRSAEQERDRMRERVAELELEVTQTNGGREIAQREANEAAARADELFAERDELTAELADVRTRAQAWRLLAIASIVLLGAAILAFIVRTRRRAASVLVPDTAEELLGATMPADESSVGTRQ